MTMREISKTTLLNDAYAVLFHPFKFFDKNEEKTIPEAIIYIISLSFVVQIVSIVFEHLFIKTSPSLTFSDLLVNMIYVIVIQVFLMIFIFVLTAIPVLTISRYHLSEKMKLEFKGNKTNARKWGRKTYANLIKTISYGITPDILFAFPALAIKWEGTSTMIGTFLLYLSLYWVILNIIGISKSCKISYLEAGLCLVLPAFLTLKGHGIIQF